MTIIGLTGGIGSGKTTVAKEFEALGVPVYIADVEAKKLMLKSKTIRKQLIELFGEKAYINEKLNKSFISNIIFNDKGALEKMNTIVHPKVAKHFSTWVKKQTTPYVLKEVAILFENGGDKYCDYVITVTAPLELRIQRLLKRDKTTSSRINAIINNQWSDEDKIKQSDFIIVNKTLKNMKKQVFEIHEKILNSRINQ